MINLEIQFFGNFRQYLECNRCEIQIPEQMTLGRLRTELLNYLMKTEGMSIKNPDQFRALLGLSAFADENQILKDDYSILKDCQLNILPPVSGG